MNFSHVSVSYLVLTALHHQKPLGLSRLSCSHPLNRQSDRRMSLPQFYTCVCQFCLYKVNTRSCKHALCKGNFTFVAATTLLFSMQNSSDFRVCRFKYFQLQILSCLECPAGHIGGCKLWGKFAAAKTKSSWVLQRCLPQIGLQKQ